MRRVKGFTLVELMVTLVILGILLGVGIPSFRAMMRGNAVVAAGNQLLGALLLARSEAVKRESQVAFSTTAGGWQVKDAGGNVLLSHTVNDDNIKVTVAGVTGTITYGSNGRSTSSFDASKDYLTVGYSGDTESARQIFFSTSGRPWIKSGGSSS